ncbi:phosphate ABC transporter permease subunit PstC [Haliovirga abyssi]|uniref:Phosphate transport system permease protein n=1 Tax=Haliovirga abyssi TaxID=2996794 RepID=A0AAU9DS54_9FUSO|nr:phosphate ABC transporter permease subunit PstC [Haliovirga abyssi]BDU49824.1 phosphate ABC transporter permease subunit PstC [Haliovirga abyssi]
MGKKRKIINSTMSNGVKLIAIFNIVIVFMIFLFIFFNSLDFFMKYPINKFLFGEEWRIKIGNDLKSIFGMLPLLKGSLIVTFIAIIISVPLSFITTIYIAEFAGKKEREIMKILIETMAAIPSVVLGFIGLKILSTPIKDIFNLDSGKTALTGGIILAFMAMPTIISISDDALKSLDKSYKDASLALGATKLQTTFKVLVPAAFSGIFASMMLGFGRVIGETMTVLMVTGNAPIFKSSPLTSVRTMTATIAAEMGESVNGSLHQKSLFAIGLILFILTFLVNIIADHFVEKSRKKMRE